MTDKHHQHPDYEDWLARKGRFADLEEDTEDRPQVMPVPEPHVTEQTHVNPPVDPAEESDAS
jgi:hypothetical protein